MGSSNKLLLKYNDHTVIEEVLKQLSNSDVDDILIITGFENDRIEGLLRSNLKDRMKLVYNGNYRLGRAESIKCAVRQIRGKADAALFLVADKPTINSALINKAIDRFTKVQPAILYVQTPSGRGHPIIFSKVLFDDLLLLEGDCVGNDLVARHRDNLVKLRDNAPQIDLDDKTDYRILLENSAGRKTL